MLALLLLLAGCGSAPPADLTEVHGPWSTTDQRYEDRWFELSANQLVFGLGDGQTQVCRVSESSREELDPTTRHYRLTYVQPDGIEGVFEFEHDLRGDVIQFSNQRGLAWHRREP